MCTESVIDMIGLGAIIVIVVIYFLIKGNKEKILAKFSKVKSLSKLLHKWDFLPYYVVINGEEMYLTESMMNKLSFKTGDILEKVDGSMVSSGLRKCSCGNVFFVANRDDLENGASFTEKPLRLPEENENFMAIVFLRTCKKCGDISYYRYVDRSGNYCDKDGNFIEKEVDLS